MLDLEELKTEQNLKDYADHNLRKGRSGMYFCPACGEEHDKPSLSIDGNLFKCFYSGCGVAGSVIDLIKANEDLDDKEAIKRTRELYDPTYDPYWTPPSRSSNKPTAKPKQEGSKPMNRTTQEEPPRRDFRNYFKRCRERISETDYPKRRGLDLETVRRFGLGYDPTWTSPTAEWNRKRDNEEIEKENKRLQKEGKPLLPLKKPASPSPRLIIPIGNNNYLARDVRPDDELNDYQKDHKKLNEGRDKPFFNLEAIDNPLYFIIVEGELDCISILQAGGNCLALGSTVRDKKFAELLKLRDPMETGKVVICLDDDTSGKNATETIINACEIAGLEYMLANLNGDYHDPNDFLVYDRPGFYKAVQDVVSRVRAEKLEEYDTQSAAEDARSFMSRPETAGAAITTGFKKLDDFLGGGLCHGLIFIGGLSSLGKTTLAMQICEHVAEGGTDVIYFALEQGKNELISKILSRRTYLESMKQGKGEKLAKTNLQLLQRGTWKDWPQKEFDCLAKCYTDFKMGNGKRFRIVESVGNNTAKDIETVVKKHIAYTGRTPLCVVDYLQILKPLAENMTDKQAIDRTITTLKRISRDYDMAIIGISSFNRENAWQNVSMTSFMGSSNVEYSADILLAISPAGMKEVGKEAEDKADNRKTVANCREKKDKDIQLHVLKNRNGKTTGTKNQLFFTFHSYYNHFEEAEGPSPYDPFKKGNPSL